MGLWRRGGHEAGGALVSGISALAQGPREPQLLLPGGDTWPATCGSPRTPRLHPHLWCSPRTVGTVSSVSPGLPRGPCQSARTPAAQPRGTWVFGWPPLETSLCLSCPLADAPQHLWGCSLVSSPGDPPGGNDPHLAGVSQAQEGLGACLGLEPGGGTGGPGCP